MAKRNKNPRIKILYTKLGREHVWGHADEYPLHIDERLRGKKKMEIILHEATHYLQGTLTEEQVESIAIRLTKTLWHEGYRCIENPSKEIPLQDGSH